MDTRLGRHPTRKDKQSRKGTVMTKCVYATDPPIREQGKRTCSVCGFEATTLLGFFALLDHYERFV